MEGSKRYLIYDTVLSGHHIEYLHHIYNGAISDSDNKYIIAVPELFKEKKTLLNWPEVPNIDFYYIKENDINKKSRFNAYNKARLLGKVCKKTQPTHLFLIMLMSYLPFIFLVPNGIKISGVIYRIYLYDWKNESLFKKIKDFLTYFVLTKTKRISRAFILNDKISTIYLNKIWSTNIFHYLPDPYVPFVENEKVNIRHEYGISSQKKVFLHIGSISKRKGTLEIFKIIERLDEKKSNNYCFIIAGKFDEKIKKELYSLYECVKNKVQIVLIDSFIPYEDIANLCKNCDFLLLPYLETSRSSGIIGYGAQFGKPSIVPRHGLLGKLVMRYDLGICLKDDFVDSFINNRNRILQHNQSVSNRYLKEHTTKLFSSIILNQNYSLE